MSEILWSPSPARIAGTNIARFTATVRERHGLNADDYGSLHRWSIENRSAFWSAIWEYGSVIGDRGDGLVLVDGDRMPGAKWFPGARLNFAENLLRRRDDAPAILFRGEDRVRYALSFPRAARPCVPDRAGVARGRGRNRRSGRRLPAQHARNRRGDARHHEHRRDLVVRIARLRRAGRGGSLRPDRAEGAVQRRRLLLRRQALRFDWPARADRGAGPVDRTHRRGAVHHALTGRLLRGSRGHPRCVRGRPNAGGHRVRASPIRPSPLHHVLVGDDGGAEVHRARGGRDAAAAHQGAGPAQRREARRAAPLFSRPAAG